jgi:hypothetical protein
MSKQVPQSEEQLLVERLQREAAESRPAFSESLHRRIVAAVKQRHAGETRVADAPLVFRRPLRVLPAALAAACLLCAVAIGSWFMENVVGPGTVPAVPPTNEVSLNDLPSLDDLTKQAVVGLDHYAVSIALEPQATHLKQDARAVAGVFLDRVPGGEKLVDNR